ncbi:MAG: DUF4870 domain-containing protein [Deltaproteobacteria bacterium]|nr:DUF4870 domain-containing protein [Deltaproteobacteria bacterium]MBW2362094.1 DUF4870 domain-containing protein [Deltaproteobacteria bacterium]
MADETLNSPDGASSTGLDPKLAGVLCYLLVFASGILFVLIEKEDRYVRFHAYQSTATFLAIFIVSVAASLLPLIGWMISAVLPLISLVLWILLMVKAFQGVRYKLPIVGDWAEEASA